MKKLNYGLKEWGNGNIAMLYIIAIVTAAILIPLYFDYRPMTKNNIGDDDGEEITLIWIDQNNDPWYLQAIQLRNNEVAIRADVGYLSKINAAPFFVRKNMGENLYTLCNKSIMGFVVVYVKQEDEEGKYKVTIPEDPPPKSDYAYNFVWKDTGIIIIEVQNEPMPLYLSVDCKNNNTIIAVEEFSKAASFITSSKSRLLNSCCKP